MSSSAPSLPLSLSVLPPSAMQIANRRAIARWLCLVLVMLFTIVLVGGATRMTGSGLSITEWKPIHGVIPPIGAEQWSEEFEKYQQIAQYVHINQGMSLSEFKVIFWWEWVHRLLARLVGVVIVLLLVVFAWQGRLEKAVGWRLLGIGALIGLQGAIGWWMVYSGLDGSDLTYVSQYRLAIHLIAASITMIAVTCLIYQLVNSHKIRPILDLDSKNWGSKIWHNALLRHGAGVLVFLILFQIYLGALVAGIHAGKAYNSWPLMDGAWIPDGLFILKPWWMNFFENALTVQFVHRIFAYLLLIVAVIHVFTIERFWPATTHARQARLLLAFIIVQAIFGIVTLISSVPIEWGLIHQGAALVLLCFACVHWQAIKLGKASN